MGNALPHITFRIDDLISADLFEHLTMYLIDCFYNDHRHTHFLQKQRRHHISFQVPDRHNCHIKILSAQRTQCTFIRSICCHYMRQFMRQILYIILVSIDTHDLIPQLIERQCYTGAKTA